MDMLIGIGILAFIGMAIYYGGRETGFREGTHVRRFRRRH